MKKHTRRNIERLDEAIEKLTIQLEEPIYSKESAESLNARLSALTDARTKLYDSQKKNSIGPTLITGGFGMTAVLLVLYYEKADIITSKAFNVAMRMIEG